MLHCDVKLGNIYLDRHMVPKLGDFGLALAKLDAAKLQYRNLAGTPNYLAPEQLENAPPSMATEVWSLGCCLYTLYKGHAPFEAKDVKETYYRVKNHTVNLSHDPNRDLATLIEAMLNKTASRRPTLYDVRSSIFLSQPVIVHPMTSELIEREPYFFE